MVATAKAQRWEPVEVLRALLAEEAAGRDRSALATRRAAAVFPTGKTLHRLDPGAQLDPGSSCPSWLRELAASAWFPNRSLISNDWRYRRSASA